MIRFKHSEYAAIIDKGIFEDWAHRHISTEKAIELLKRNNQIFTEITPVAFELEANSLGYYRRSK